MCDGLDKAVARQEGDAVAGDRCRQRAEALQAAGRLLDALREFHQAKINWFHGDTLYGALRAMACITDIYSALGMYLAAKKYALAMAALALRADPADRELIPMALFSAANMDHLAGAWVASAELATIAGQAHLRWAPDAGNLERHAYVKEAMEYQAFTAVIAEQTRPEFLPTIHDILRDGLFDGFTHPRAASPDTVARTEQEWTDWLSDKAGAPFSDAGPSRAVAFHALGVRWTVHGRNEQDTVLALEDFTSTLQILLAEFASLDPVLIPQDVDIEIRVYQPGHPPADTYLTRVDDEAAGCGCCSCQSGAPADRQCGGARPGRPGARRRAAPCLPGASRQLAAGPARVQRPHGSGGAQRPVLQPGNRAPVPGASAVPNPARTAARRAAIPAPCECSAPEPAGRRAAHATADRTRTGLQHRTGARDPRRALQNPPGRHQPHHSRPAVRSGALPTSSASCADAGWKDWHLLNVVANLTINHRLALRHGTITAGRARQLAGAFRAEALRAEEPGDPKIAPDQITLDVMEQGIRLVAMSSLHRWGLALHHGTTDSDAIMRLLAERYGFWDDDVPHTDPFHGQLAVDNSETDKE